MATSAAHPDLVVRTSEVPTLRPLSRLRELLGAREVLGNLVRKEVRVRYKASVLGAGWSMLNPLLYLAVFTLVFQRFLGRGVPNFAVYLLSGLLAWQLFAGALTAAARSVVDNASLVTKVYFPREILPLAAVGSTLVDFALHGVVLLLFLLGTRHDVVGAGLALLPLSFAALLVLTTALALWVAALNVRYRDTQHLLALALLVWFWLTPVVYPSGHIHEALARHEVLGVSLFHVYLANPMAAVVAGFQRALYGVVRDPASGAPLLFPVSVEWLALLNASVLAGSLVLLLLAWRTFFHLSGDFGEEL
jgi:ABC-2 type transport system permease protein